MKKLTLLCSCVCLSLSSTSAFSNTGEEIILHNSNTIFNWAESQYFQYFPNHESLFSSDQNTITSAPGWLYRYYPSSDNYIGIKENNLYVAGTAFDASPNDPMLISSVEEILSQIDTGETYANKISQSGASLPYTVLRDDINQIEIRNGGFGSAATAHPTLKNHFYALTDRGPNASYTGSEGKGKIFPTPDYTPRIGLFKVTLNGQVEKVSEILLKDTNASPISGLPNTSALGGTGETPYDAEGNVIVTENGNIKLDDFGLDSEGLVALKDGTFWISDEYGPHIVHYDADGKEIGRINPFSNDTRTTFNLPAEFANRRANRGMEGLAITPDQSTLVGIMQSTIYNPDSSVKNLDITRIVTINTNTGAVGQYLYRQNKTQNSNSEIVALTATEFLVIERDGSFYQGGSKSASTTAQKHVYRIDLSTASNIENIATNSSKVQDENLGLTIDGLTLEQYILNNSWEALEKQGIHPVQKTLVVDMVAENGYPHDKMEGLWVIDANTLGILNDDDFATWSTDGVLEAKYINSEKTIIDGNHLYIVNHLNLSETITPLARYRSGIFDDSAAEIVSYDSQSQQFYVTNGSNHQIDILKLQDNTLNKIRSIDLSSFGGGVNSVSAHQGLVAVAVEAENKQDMGTIEFFNADGTHLKTIQAGPLPDMVTFSKDGNMAVVANEGEPSDDYSTDPKGSVTIINLASGIDSATAVTLDFSAVTLPSQGMKYYNSDKSADVEPEYVAINESNTKAYITLQENNGIAIIDLVNQSIEKVVGLGFKDFSQTGNEIDANNDGIANLTNINAFGMYQPDSIAVYTVNGEDYIVTANEGDDREYDAYEEETKVSKLNIDPNLDMSNIGDSVRVTPELGDENGNGIYEQLYLMGARSFSIWDSNGGLVFDSGSQLAQQVINALGSQHFNTRVDDTDDPADIAELDSKGTPYSLVGDTAYFFEGLDARSEKKGIEPEALTLGSINGKTYAFIGLEKQGGFFVYDISNPQAPNLVKYVNSIDYTQAPMDAGDLGPEGMTFVPASDSPNGKNLLVVANEISGTTTIYEIKQ